MLGTILAFFGTGAAVATAFNPSSIPGVNGLSAKITDVEFPLKAQIDQWGSFNKVAIQKAFSPKDANGDPIISTEDVDQLVKDREDINTNTMKNSVHIAKNACLTVAGAGVGIALGSFAASLVPGVGIFLPTILGLTGASIYGTKTASNLVALKLVNDAKQGTLDFHPLAEPIRSIARERGSNNLTPSEFLTRRDTTVDIFEDLKIFKQLGGSYAYAARDYIKSLKESGMPLLTIAGNIASSLAGPILSKIDPTASPNKVTA